VVVRSTRSLLEQIEEGALDSKTSLADVLRKCVALGGRTGSEQLRDWARRELDGYGDGRAELPSYRVVQAAICIDGANLAYAMKGQQISTFQLPEFARDAIGSEAPIPYGVAQIEKMSEEGPGFLQLQHPGMPDVVLYMNREADYGSVIHSMYWRIAPVSVYGILDSIRTKLVALVAEMRAAGPEEVPSAEAANQAVQIVIHNADRSRFTINTNQATGHTPAAQAITQNLPPETKQRIPAWIRGPWAFAVGAAAIVAAAVSWAVWADWSPFS
jgi:hypothetical protein